MRLLIDVNMVNDQDGHEILHDDIQTIKDTLDNMEIELKKMPFADSFHFLKPIRYMVYEAWRQLKDERNVRSDGADDIINSVI